jgi:hypothetical protein
MAREGFYVDYLITGSYDVDTALSLQQDLIWYVKARCICTRKWLSNHPELLKHFSPEAVETKLILTFGNKDLVKALGLLWNPTTEKLRYCVLTAQGNVPTIRSA